MGGGLGRVCVRGVEEREGWGVDVGLGGEVR